MAHVSHWSPPQRGGYVINITYNRWYLPLQGQWFSDSQRGIDPVYNIIYHHQIRPWIVTIAMFPMNVFCYTIIFFIVALPATEIRSYRITFRSFHVSIKIWYKRYLEPLYLPVKCESRRQLLLLVAFHFCDIILCYGDRKRELKSSVFLSMNRPFLALCY